MLSPCIFNIIIHMFGLKSTNFSVVFTVSLSSPPPSAFWMAAYWLPACVAPIQPWSVCLRGGFPIISDFSCGESLTSSSGRACLIRKRIMGLAVSCLPPGERVFHSFPLHPPGVLTCAWAQGALCISLRAPRSSHVKPGLPSGPALSWSYLGSHSTQSLLGSSARRSL